MTSPKPVTCYPHHIENVKPTLLNEANERLEQLGGFVRLKYNNNGQVVPIWIPAPPSSYHSVLNTNISEETPQFWSDCFRISAACLGSEVMPESSWFQSHEWSQIYERAITMYNREEQQIEAIDCPLATNLAEKFCYATLCYYEGLFKEALEKIGSKSERATPKVLRKELDDSSIPLSVGNLKDAISKLKPTKTVVHDGGCVDGKSKEKAKAEPSVLHKWKNYQELWEIYAKLFLEKNLLTQIAKDLKINEFVCPHVGDTLIIVPALGASTWSRWVIKDGYNPNFHWAPIVLTTEEGYICLENFAVLNPLEINSKWEFRYYKFSEGGYHQKLMEGGGYGNVAITLLVRKLT